MRVTDIPQIAQMSISEKILFVEELVKIFSHVSNMQQHLQKNKSRQLSCWQVSE